MSRRRICIAVLACATCASSTALGARPEAPLLPLPWSGAGVPAPNFDRPYRIGGLQVELPDPVWAGDGLRAAPPRRLLGLAPGEHSGAAVWDRSTGAWFASVAGELVRLSPEGRLVSVASDIQGLDVDVRAGLGLAVAREDDAIVLHRFGSTGRSKSVLIAGEGYFGPRLSPDGSLVLVERSRPDGGRFLVVDLRGRARDLGPGYGAAWHPDGRHVLYAQVRHDGYRILASDLHVVDLISSRRQLVSRTSHTAEMEPAVSPDGRWLAYLDGLTGDLCVVSLPKLGGR